MVQMAMFYLGLVLLILKVSLVVTQPLPETELYRPNE